LAAGRETGLKIQDFVDFARLAPCASLFMFKNNVQRKCIPGMCVFQVYLKGLVGGNITTYA